MKSVRPSYNKQQVSLLPSQPGVYRFLNKKGTIIYVGKAKDIKKRVASYFNKKSLPDRKTMRMVSEIDRIECTLVNSEFDALLLENSLIKKNQPRYNILLKDDKSFPYIWIPDERFPRILSIRNKQHYHGGQFFGPYASVVAMKSVLNLIRDLYTIRTCKFQLSEENISKGKFKLCLEYHIGNCKGPCEGLQNETDYQRDIAQAKHILKGKLGLVKGHFKKEMQKASDRLDFERAQRMKDRLHLLEKFQARSTIVNQRIRETEVFSIVSDENMAFVGYLKIKRGSIEMAQTIEIKKKLNEANQDILPNIIVDLRERTNSSSKEVLVNLSLDLELDDAKILTPKIGDKKKLVALAVKNALFQKKQYYQNQVDQNDRGTRALQALQKDLNLKALPRHIECFDNSNIQGSDPVASMVFFRNGKPAKKEYRHYNIKTVVGPDDFASMHEVTFRRYSRLLSEGASLPDLIVIDGGKGQLNAACQALKELDIYGQIPIVGIAKRLEEIYFPGDQYPVHVEKKSISLKLLQQVRDEAHRFAINFHRQKRSIGSLGSQLEEVPGIGTATVNKLLKKFKSVKNIKAAAKESLVAEIGESKTEKLLAGLK